MGAKYYFRLRKSRMFILKEFELEFEGGLG